MKVSVYDPFVNEKEINSFGGKKIGDFRESIKAMDYVSIHIPLNNETKNLINANVLDKMKQKPILINTSR